MAFNDEFDLERFVQAQERDYDQALSEIRAGRKRSHWMWYIFPQFDGLGFSAMSRRYSIKSLDEAHAYLIIRSSARGWWSAAKRCWALKGGRLMTSSDRRMI
jgi:uncharacterized protein (DUF1810 family)